MKIETKLGILVVFLVMVFIGGILGLFSLAKIIAEHYGPAAGMFTILLPAAAATLGFILLWHKSEEDEKK